MQSYKKELSKRKYSKKELPRIQWGVPESSQKSPAMTCGTLKAIAPEGSKGVRANEHLVL